MLHSDQSITVLVLLEADTTAMDNTAYVIIVLLCLLTSAIKTYLTYFVLKSRSSQSSDRNSTLLNCRSYSFLVSGPFDIVILTDLLLAYLFITVFGASSSKEKQISINFKQNHGRVSRNLKP
jgi:hypothetical protein